MGDWGSGDKPGLKAGGTNAFNFVINITKPISATNATAKVTFSRIILESGKLPDVINEVQIHSANK